MTAERVTEIPEEETILIFSGVETQEGSYTIITCNEAPIVGWAKSPAEALEDARLSLELYRNALQKRGELMRALADGIIPSIIILNTPKSLASLTEELRLSHPVGTHILLIPLSEHLPDPNPTP